MKREIAPVKTTITTSSSFKKRVYCAMSINKPINQECESTMNNENTAAILRMLKQADEQIAAGQTIEKDTAFAEVRAKLCLK